MPTTTEATPARRAVERIRARRRGEHAPEPGPGPLRVSHTSGLPLDRCEPLLVRGAPLSFDDFCRLVPDHPWYVAEHGSEAADVWLRAHERGMTVSQQEFVLGHRDRLAGSLLSYLVAHGFCDRRHWRLTELGCAMRRHLAAERRKRGKP